MEYVDFLLLHTEPIQDDTLADITCSGIVQTNFSQYVEVDVCFFTDELRCGHFRKIQGLYFDALDLVHTVPQELLQKTLIKVPAQYLDLMEKDYFIGDRLEVQSTEIFYHTNDYIENIEELYREGWYNKWYETIAAPILTEQYKTKLFQAVIEKARFDEEKVVDLIFSFVGIYMAGENVKTFILPSLGIRDQVALLIPDYCECSLIIPAFMFALVAALIALFYS